MRIVKVFWGLDSSLAYARHFPAMNWLTQLLPVYGHPATLAGSRHVNKDWTENRYRA